ncbi:hypothetical protein ACQKEI_05295 [Psychrobacter namhaensis]|uniref:hypothetical protein n=1 Tax=Psychrobacter namhaensis TaxID=292734 RepID=UPI003D06A43A
MNGRKARGLRNEAAHYAESFDTDYQTEKRLDSFGRQRIVLKNPRMLVEGCHRAVYQQLKKGV